MKLAEETATVHDPESAILREPAETPPLLKGIVTPRNAIGPVVAMIETGMTILGGTGMIIQETETMDTETVTATIMAAETQTATKRTRGGGGTMEDVMNVSLPDVATAASGSVVGTTGSRLTETGNAKERAETGVPLDETDVAAMLMMGRKTERSGRRRRNLLGWKLMSPRRLVPASSVAKPRTVSWTEFKRGRKA